jgi:predicted transcriptional regulator
MNNELKAYSESLVKVYIESGLTNSTARVLVYLTLCEPTSQAATSIQQHVSLSAGSVSTALNLLLRSGLIIRTKSSGDKRYFYELESESWQRSVMQRLVSVDHLVHIADKGIKLAPDNKRLIAMYEMYSFFGLELKEMMKRFNHT